MSDQYILDRLRKLYERGVRDSYLPNTEVEGEESDILKKYILYNLDALAETIQEYEEILDVFTSKENLGISQDAFFLSTKSFYEKNKFLTRKQRRSLMKLIIFKKLKVLQSNN